MYLIPLYFNNDLEHIWDIFNKTYTRQCERVQQQKKDERTAISFWCDNERMWNFEINSIYLYKLIYIHVYNRYVYFIILIFILLLWTKCIIYDISYTPYLNLILLQININEVQNIHSFLFYFKFLLMCRSTFTWPNTVKFFSGSSVRTNKIWIKGYMLNPF